MYKITPPFLSFRLTDPIPTTETSIAPRQRPKAGQAQPITGILPIQPALTPRKRASVPAPASNQPISKCFELRYRKLPDCLLHIV